MKEARHKIIYCMTPFIQSTKTEKNPSMLLEVRIVPIPNGREGGNNWQRA